MIPDGEHVIRAYLDDHPDITVPVVGKPPDKRNVAWAQLRLLDARNAIKTHREHLVSYMVQIDCYASPAGVSGSQQREATGIARAVRAAIVDMPGAHDDVVVTNARIVGMTRVPDNALEPARERVILTAIVDMHG